MAITLRGHAKPFGSGSTGTSAAVSSTAIVGLAANDVVIACFYIDQNNVPVTPPSGWTQIDNLNNSGGPFNEHTYWHAYTASEPANWTWTLGSAVFWDVELIAFVGCNTTTEPDVHSIVNSATATSITTTGADAVVMFNINFTGNTIAASGFTIVENNDGLGLGYLIQSSSGSQGATVTGGAGATTTSLIGISPAGGGGGSIVSGSANVQSNAAIADSPNDLITPASMAANAALGEAAQLLASAPIQSNSAISDAPNILITPATEQANAAIGVTVQMVASAAVTANAAMSVTAQVVSPAKVASNAAIAEHAQIVAPAVLQANAVLSASGSIIGFVEGSASVTSNSAISVAARLVTSAAPLQANAFLSLPAAQVTQPTIAAQSNAALHQASASIFAAPTFQANAALVQAAALLLAGAIAMQSNSVLSAIGTIPLPAGYHSPTGSTLRGVALTGGTAEAGAPLASTTVANAPTAGTVKE